ncbi:MAG: AEC family transporter [Candidatus Heimdallarchaeota archaeon]
MATFLEGFFELLFDLIIVYLMIAGGVIWRFSRYYSPEYGKWFTSIVIWVFFPISIISSFAGIGTLVGITVLQITLVAVSVHGFSSLVMYILVRNRPAEEAGSLVLCGTFPNALLFPFPIILAILGDNGLVYATIYVFIAMTLRNSLGVLIGMHYNPQARGHESQTQIAYKLVKDLLKFPPFLALLLGFFLHALFGPQAIGQIPGIDFFKTISLYGALVLVGVSFQDIKELHPRNLLSRNVLEVSFTRFLIGPAVAAFFIIIFQSTGLIAIPLIIQSMAPPAVANILYGKFFNLDEGQISLLITSLTFLALLILPFEVLLLQWIFL